MSVPIYVIDTSYLCEIAGCDGYSQPDASKEVRKRFKKAMNQGGRFFVPLPCLFELGDHIADVKHEEKRTKLAEWLRETVTQCLEKSKPWTITPAQSPADVLPSLMARFVPLAGKQKIGLVDAFTESEAKRLKANFKDRKGRVHIWTNDAALKKLEPDEETNPYLWKADGTPR